MVTKFTPQGRRREAALHVAQLPGVDEEIKKALINKIMARDSGNALQSDRVIYRIVVSALGGIALVALVAVLWLSLAGDPKETTVTKHGTTTTTTSRTTMPDIFLALGSAAVGALAGLLAPSPRHGNRPRDDGDNKHNGENGDHDRHGRPSPRGTEQ